MLTPRSVTLILTACATIFACSLTHALATNFNFFNLSEQVLSKTLTVDAGVASLTISTNDNWFNIGCTQIRLNSNGLRIFNDSQGSGFSFNKAVIFQSYLNGY